MLAARLFVALAITASTVLAGNAYFPPLPAEVAADLARRDPSEYQTFQLRDDAFEAELTKRGAPNGLNGLKTRCTTSHCFDFTFDDGPYINSRTIVDAANAAGIKVTFFVNVLNYACSYDKQFADDLIHAYQSGHQICSHTATHPDLTKLTHAQIDTEVELVETMLHKIIGAVPSCLRPPFGSINDDIVNYLNNKHDLVVVTWNFDSGDSVGKSVAQSEAIYKKIKSPKHAIVLNHETEDSTAKKLFPAAIKIAKANGYTNANFQTVPQSLKFNGYKSVTKPGKRDSTWNCDAAKKSLCSYDPKNGYC